MFAEVFCHSYPVDGRHDTDRFGDIVRERREHLGRQQERMTDYGGPSSTTMSQIEQGKLTSPSPATLRKLDTGLEWEPGSARRTLDGGNPVTIEQTPNLSMVPSDALLAEIRRRIVAEPLLEKPQDRAGRERARAAFARQGMGIENSEHRDEHGS